MSTLFSEAKFPEADVTYKASVELEYTYLFNLVVFNYTTLQCVSFSLNIVMLRHVSEKIASGSRCEG